MKLEFKKKLIHILRNYVHCTYKKTYCNNPKSKLNQSLPSLPSHSKKN